MAVVMQHRSKCDQVLLSKTMIVIYLMVKSGFRVHRLSYTMKTLQAPELVSKPRLKFVPTKHKSDFILLH
jgi:hypothetical protein